MGLLLKLKNGETQLKSLKYGKDRLGGGDSGQPYIQKSIDTEPGKGSGPDFILRGGFNAIPDALTDVKRLTKYLFDPKSISGGLFVAKQNLLSRISPKTETSKGPAYAGGALNNGVYTPLSTLAQAGVGFLGGHLNKQGLDPTGLIPGLSLNKYEKIAYVNNIGGSNRLVRLTDLSLSNRGENNFGFVKGYGLNIGNDVITYDGGPGSILGVGQTHIRYATDSNGVPLRTGINNPLLFTQPLKHQTTINETKYVSKIQQKLKEYGRELLSDSTFDIGNISGDVRVWAATSNTSSPKIISKYSSRETLDTDLNNIGENRKDINKPKLLNSPNTQGYLANLNKNSGIYEDPKNPGKYITQHNPYRVGGFGISSDFRLVNRNKRGFYDPDTAYDYITQSTDYSKVKTLDRIYYDSSSDKRKSNSINSSTDIIPFNISIINPTNLEKTTLNFRAYIDSFSDSYSSDIKSQTYMGRGEKFYKYDSFERNISMAFTIVAENRSNLDIMYKQLNTLASSLAPTYTGKGYMVGNMHEVTLGAYIRNQTGIITDITYDITDESPWEIEKNNELPFYIKVTGIKFIPIHKFRPESQFNNIHQFINQ